MKADFWKGKKVLITGHTGFKGAWLSLLLQFLNAKVTGYALQPPTNPSLFEIGNVAEGMTSIIGDIRNFEYLNSVFSEINPEIVIHMAAQALVRYSYANPVETYATNLMGTVHVLECIRRAVGVKAVVIVSSDKCYENQEWFWGYRENEPMGGFDPYSNSKGCAELATNSYRRSYFHPDRHAEHGVAVASARAGNVIGGGDWALDRLVPDIMRAIQSGEIIRIRNPSAIRPWQHVLEPLNGYLHLAKKLFEEGPSYAEGWNFGPNEQDAKSVYWIVERLTGLWGKNAGWVHDLQPQPHEAHYLKLDCSKARQRLGWEPRWNLNEALKRLIDWHKAMLSGYDMKRISLEQIANYLTKCRSLDNV